MKHKKAINISNKSKKDVDVSKTETTDSENSEKKETKKEKRARLRKEKKAAKQAKKLKLTEPSSKYFAPNSYKCRTIFNCNFIIIAHSHA